jgi:hypothetical protein
MRKSIMSLLVCGIILFAGLSIATAEDFNFEKFQEQIKNLKKADMKYKNIVVNRITISSNPEINKDDNPKEFTSTTEAALTGLLEDSNLFDSVTLGKAPNNAASTLIVKAELTDFRVVSTAKRIFLGIMAGHSNMELKATLIDAAVGNVITESAVGDSAMMADSGVARNVGERLFALVINNCIDKKQ